MKFAGKIWRFLVGIKDALVLIFMLLFFTLLFSALTVRPSPGAVRDGALLLDLNGLIVEEVSDVDPFEALVAQSLPIREYAARDLVRAIDAAANDTQIKAIALDLSGFLGGGHVHLQDISSALGRFREADKPVFAYGLVYLDSHLALAANASEIWLDPIGSALIKGPGGERQYYGDALEQFNIDVRVYRTGDYKSAAETLTESAMSDEAREDLSAIYTGLWDQYRANLTGARPQVDFAMATQNYAAWFAAADNNPAQAAKNAGLIDTIGTREQWGTRIAEVTGEDEWSSKPGAFAKTTLDPFLATVNNDTALTASGTVGVITIAGQITDADTGPGTAGAARIERILDNALGDELSALVVRVNSPGGTVTGSETIRRAIMRHKDKGIPIAVSFGNIAASGGYYVATPGQRIFAEPETVTGSIGVILSFPTFDRFLGGYGVNSDGVRTTPLSGQPDPVGGLTPAIDEVLGASVNNSYNSFLRLVADARGISLERADTLGQGKIYAGGAARQLGLVDEFGGLDDAVAWAAAQAGLEDGKYNVRLLTEESDDFWNTLAADIFSDDEEARAPRDLAGLLARREQARLGNIVHQFGALLNSEGIMAQCIPCAPLDGAAARPDKRTAPDTLAALLSLLR